MADRVVFHLNGEKIELDAPSPGLLLVDHLRSAGVGLTGTKKSCAQGGCGACTVVLSQRDARTGEPEHRAANSCLRPVCSLDGMAVTTIEGTGSVRRPVPESLSHQTLNSRSGAPPDYTLPAVAEAAEAAARIAQDQDPEGGAGEEGEDATDDGCGAGCTMNPVAHRLAANNGTQCGFCTPGFVMNMTEYLVNHPRATKADIEHALDGNLCRCTGYRSILTGMKTFAEDWSDADEAKRMRCIPEPVGNPPAPGVGPYLALPEGVRREPRPLTVESGGRRWHTVTGLAGLKAVMDITKPSERRLVCANTSYGVYPQEVADALDLVDIRRIPELHGVSVSGGDLQVGAATTYTDLITALDSALDRRGNGGTAVLETLRHMARRTAGTVLRNTATVGGNTMMVLRHILTGAVFPSDLFTALVALGARITYWRASTQQRTTVDAGDLVALVGEGTTDLDDLVLLHYTVPLGTPDTEAVAHKTALREVNAHALVNAAVRLEVDPEQSTPGENGSLWITSCDVVLGGVDTGPWRAEGVVVGLTGSALTVNGIDPLVTDLRVEVEAVLAMSAERRRAAPDEGITDDYLADLATGFLRKSLITALHNRGVEVPPRERSAGETTWGNRPVSDGVQKWTSQSWRQPVAEPHVKRLSMYQASGQLHYTQDVPVDPTTAHAALAVSRRALASFAFTDPDTAGATGPDALRKHLAEAFPDSFLGLVAHDDVPATGINAHGMGSDQPLFAVDRVGYVGQCLALVAARTEHDARKIADHVSEHCVSYGVVDWPEGWKKPILTLGEAIDRRSVFPDCPRSASFVSHIWKVTRPGSRFDWTEDKRPGDRAPAVRAAEVDGRPCTVVEHAQSAGGQAHFYMETHTCLVEPLDGDRWLVRPASQSPMEMHQTVAMALGVEHHRVQVEVNQLGGGYGGKTEAARFVTGPTAVAAHALRRPVRLALEREQDSRLIGKRHPYYGQYQIALDTGEKNPADKGVMRGVRTQMWGDGGAFYDCSFIVSNCIQLRADNAYRVANFENTIDVCRTNTAPNTAFRAFGDIQGKLITENAVDDAAHAIGMAPEDVREKNLYERGDVTPYGQALTYCYIREVWEHLKQVCGHEAMRARVAKFNAENRWRKRGMAMIPVKYGSGYNLAMLEQAAAHVVVHAGDGSVVVHQGGVEMGQGVVTKVEQIASHVLGVPMSLLRVTGPRTDVIPNPTSTGASTGTAYNGEAVKQVCEKLRQRLTDFATGLRREKGDAWCKQQGIDHWNHPEQGWAASTRTGKLVWQNLVQLAYSHRVDLVAAFTAPMTGGEDPLPALTYKPREQQPSVPGIEVDPDAVAGGGVDSFTGFTYSAACSEVEVDVLTGEVTVVGADIVYDMGRSINPAVDVGQVEGAFVQGIGYLLTEHLAYETEGEEKGRLNSTNTWTYKPPAVSTVPQRMDVHLFPRDKAGAVPENPNDLMSSKEVGEPPLVLASTVFFAVKEAVRAAREENGLHGLFRLDAPATVQEVRRACRE
ncbi:molybdopterin-dependent oxidoreductase [Nocardiopsis sp. HNM0947]|uniref:Molybdopterin-dependent oxidoreductase n=1 Tax=Nocardiopsis coralli TaxID=2772213 RepID=A0ABR9P5E3_9ACTN|nr:molybdopterin cofactor-binding domain-containing protein [Nocardiopsis coralli]MBE2998925.1 molybdopterin-dependent oxidoreductase [Nocardiopsis coralli]